MGPQNQVGNHNSEPASQSRLNREGCDTDDVAGSPSISGPVAVPSCPGLTSDNTDQLQNQIHEEPVTSSDKNDIHDDHSKDNDEGVQSEALNFEDELVSMMNFRYELQEQMNRLIQKLQAVLERCRFLEDKLLRHIQKHVSWSRASSSDKSRLHGGITSPALSHSEKLPRRAAPDLLDPSASIANNDSTNSEDLQSEDAPPGSVGGNGMFDPSCSTTTAASSEPLPVGDVSSASSADWEHLGARPKQGQIQHQQSLPVESVSSGSTGDLPECLGARPKQGQMQHQQSLPVEDVSSGSLFNEGTLQGSPYADNWEGFDAQPRPPQLQHLLAEPRPEDISPLSDGITNACLLRNSQDPTILARIVPQQEDITACSRGNDNSSCSILNRDVVANSVDGTDNSLLALEQRVTKACALVERVLREREEREQFGREIERKEQMIREERERERREREEREIEEAERWPQHQEAITAHSQWLCEHYQHRCRVRFPCCADFYPCHRCHNNSVVCDNKDVKAHHATHFLCSRCCSEQEVDGNGMKCHRCGRNMSAYVCFNCGHFSPTDEDTYQCEKCGICRIQTEKACEDQCCFCLEDAFSGRQCLPCSHTVHRECLTMIQDSIMTCPICRYPLYNPSGW